MATISNGWYFLTNHWSESYYSYSKSNSFKEITDTRIEYPKILANVGSGVSFMKITGYDDFKRVSGTMISGSTLHALCNVLYNQQFSYQEITEKLYKGNHINVDLWVKDIYGEHTKFDISGDTVAGSLAKISNSYKNINKEDVFQSIGFLVAANISHIAVLTAQLHEVNEIWYTGNFIQNNKFIMDCLDYGVRFHSADKIRWWFIDKGGFAGAIGTLIN